MLLLNSCLLRSQTRNKLQKIGIKLKRNRKYSQNTCRARIFHCETDDTEYNDKDNCKSLGRQYALRSRAEVAGAGIEKRARRFLVSGEKMCFIAERPERDESIRMWMQARKGCSICNVVRGRLYSMRSFPHGYSGSVRISNV